MKSAIKVGTANSRHVRFIRHDISELVVLMLVAIV